MTLAAATLSDWLGLVGAALSAIGVLVTLRGTQKFRAWLTSRRPIPAIVGSASIQLEAMTMKAKGRVGPPGGVLSLEWIAENHQQQIDALAAGIDVHGHPAIDSEIARVERNTDNVRTEMLGRFEGLDTEAASTETWSRRGFYIAGLGALLQVGAVAAAFV